MKKIFLIAIFLLVMHSFASQSFAAQEGAQSFTFDGRAFADAAATSPLLDSIQLKIQILNQAQDCIIYEETQAVNTTATNGYFTIQVGSVVGAVKRSSGDSAHSMSSLFSNTITSLTGKLVSNGGACSYSPINAQLRYFRLQLTPSIDGVTRTISPNMALDAVPNAMVAERAENIQGFYPADLILVNNTAPAALNQANLESIFSTTNLPRLTSLLSVAPSNYVQTGANGSALLPVVAGNPGAGLTSGQIWYDSTANVLKYYDGAVKTVGTSGAAAGPIVDNTNSASTAIAVTQSGSGYAGTFMGGNVGIGTASPSQLLSVGAGSPFTVDASGNMSGNTLSVGATALNPVVVTGALTPDSTGIFIYKGEYLGHHYYQRGSDSWYMWTDNGYWRLSGALGDASGIRWYTSPGTAITPPIGTWIPTGGAAGIPTVAAGITNYFTIDSSGNSATVGVGSFGKILTTGNVGIGTINPSVALDVTGSIKSSNLTSGRIPFASTGGLITDSANLAWNGNQFDINGTSNPGFRVYNSGGNGWYFYNGAGGAGNFGMFDITAGKDRFVIKSDGTIDLGNLYNSPYVRITSTGDVGIGAPVPSSKLYVSGGAIVAAPASSAAQCVNFTTGNIQVSSYVATNTLNLGGLVDGGAYTLILTGYTAGQALTFNGFTDAVCSVAVATGVDFGGSTSAVTPTLTAVGNTQLVTFIYSAARGVVYASAGTNFYH